MDINIKNDPHREISRPKTPESNSKFIPAEYVNVAENLETNFNELMLAQMKKTIDKSEEESSAESYYNSLLNTEHAKGMSKTENGLGLKKIILDQIYPQRLRNEINYQAYNNYKLKNERPFQGAATKSQNTVGETNE